MSAAPKVTVVVPVHNGAPFLERCLRALSETDYENFDVVVVDDASTDGSADIARAFDCRVLSQRERRGPAAARNLAVAVAECELIFFTDADVLVKPSTIREAVEFLARDPEAAGVIGSYTKETPAAGFVSAYKNLQHHLVHQRSAGSVAGFFTACGALRREAFEAVGGFDESARDCALEDFELGLRLTAHGRRVVLAPDLQVTHLKRYTLRSLVFIEFRQRAVPYTVHLLRHRSLPDQLSTTRRKRLALAATYLSLLSAACAALTLSALWGSLAVFLFLSWLALEGELLLFLKTEKGWTFACRGMALQFLSHLYSGVGFIVGACSFALERFSGRDAARGVSKTTHGANPLERLADRRLAQLKPFRPVEPPPDTVRLGFNENPLGPSPLAVEAARLALARIGRYPDDGGRALKHALAAKLGLRPENFLLGNGGSEVLELIARAFLAPGDELVFADPSFPMYRGLGLASGATNVAVPLRAHVHDLPAMAAAVNRRTKLVFVTNPNNPTGTLLPQSEIDDFMRRVPEDVLVVFDEAYIDCVELEGAGTLGLLAQRNVVVVRTFSKMRGLAGLRVGYGVADPRLCEVLEKVRRPFNTNCVAQAAAVAALGDERHLELTRAAVREGRAFLCRQLSALGVDYIPSVTNFVCADAGRDAAEVCDELLRRGLLIKPVGPTRVRISVGTSEQNEMLVRALGEVLGRAPRTADVNALAEGPHAAAEEAPMVFRPEPVARVGPRAL